MIIYNSTYGRLMFYNQRFMNFGLYISCYLQINMFGDSDSSCDSNFNLLVYLFFVYWVKSAVVKSIDCKVVIVAWHWLNLLIKFGLYISCWFQIHLIKIRALFSPSHAEAALGVRNEKNDISNKIWFWLNLLVFTTKIYLGFVR